jgi:hypothetical protein
MGTKLIAREEYHAAQRGLHIKRGEVFEADAELYRFLMADAPEVFAPAPDPQPTKALDAPPLDKMLRKPRVKK